MPKRPSAINITPDSSLILCGDKFGDVYSLPLLECHRAKGTSSKAVPDLSRPECLDSSRDIFVPSASELTVHTKSNHEALRNQLKTRSRPTAKKTLDFEHQLLLGHVSLLTDLLYVQLDAGSSSAGARGYILTSDRDEHIRVSRGLPNSHVIETYCLGHTEFVSKLAVPRWRPDLLISGGGDNYLIVWDWINGQAIQKVDLAAAFCQWRDTFRRPGIEQKMSGQDLTDGEDTGAANIAVSGIWAMRRHGAIRREDEGHVLVAFEE